MEFVRIVQKKNIMTKRKYILVLSIIFSLALMVLFTFIFSANESRHECKGNDCPICFILNNLKNNCDKIISSFVIINVDKIISFVLIICYFSQRRIYIPTTLVSLKVKFTN